MGSGRVAFGASSAALCRESECADRIGGDEARRWLRTEKEIREKWLEENPQTDFSRPKGQYANNNGYSSGTLASTLAGSSNAVWRC